jgi:predicted negative regulator of RcsB-dependent stress response
MKAQHRHELHTNELAEWLEAAIEKAKPYSRAIVGAILAVAIVVGVYAYVSALQRRTVAAASDQYINALQSLQTEGPLELQRIAEDYRGTEPAVLAQLVLAEQQLNQGAGGLYVNKPAAETELSHAIGSFTQVSQTTKDPMLRAWALYGLGRAHESQGQSSQLDRARADYQKLIDEYPNSSLVSAARGHLAQLKETSVKEFYDWFAKQNPQPAGLDSGSGVPGFKPSFDLTEPPAPGDLKFPEPGSAKPSSQTPAESSSSTPPDDSKK